MSLSTLPLVVLDTLLLKLDLASLIALSSTCRRLHTESNRILYREPAFRWLSGDQYFRFEIDVNVFRERAIAMLERKLSENPSNAQFLQRHRTQHVKSLEAIWSNSQLRLIQLHITSNWFASSRGQVEECVNSKHKDTVVREIFVYTPQDGGYRGFLGILHTFNGLEVLHIRNACGPPPYFSPDGIIAQLNCPQLKVLDLGFSDQLASLGDKLPKLEVLTISRSRLDFFHFSDEEPQYSDPDETWARLSALRCRKICFAQTLGLDPDVDLLPFVFQYADQKRLDPNPIAKWLITSQSLLQKDGRFRLRGFSPHDRDRTLKMLKCLNIEREYRLAVTLHGCDTPTLSDLLPKTVSSLQIFVPEHDIVEPAVVPEFIRSLPELRTISIRLFVGYVDPGRMGCNATCFGSSFDGKFPALIEDDDSIDCDLVGYKLIVSRGKSPVWTAGEIYDENDNLVNREVDIDLPEVEREVLDWLSLNSGLDYVEVIFDGDDEDVANNYEL